MGLSVGDAVGGRSVGLAVGRGVGRLGVAVGPGDGATEGANVGRAEGIGVGKKVVGCCCPNTETANESRSRRQQYLSSGPFIRLLINTNILAPPLL